VPKIEAAIKEAVLRGARRQVRSVTGPVRREVRRLRHLVAQLRRDVSALRDVAAQWQRVARATPWEPAVTEAELREARLSPRLVRKLRVRLGLSQSALARLVGVSAASVVQWEQGRSKPAGSHRKNLVGLRKLGRRDIKRLLAGMERERPLRRPRRPRRVKRRRAASRRRRRS
jgi:DNA-binding transcriptional regulator YiaG